MQCVLSVDVKLISKNDRIDQGMRIRVRSDPYIFDPPDQDPLLHSLDPDPTCNNGFKK